MPEAISARCRGPNDASQSNLLSPQEYAVPSLTRISTRSPTGTAPQLHCRCGVCPGRRLRVLEGSSARRGAIRPGRRRPPGGGSKLCVYTETVRWRERQEKETKGRMIGGLLRFAPGRLGARQDREPAGFVIRWMAALW